MLMTKIKTLKNWNEDHTKREPIAPRTHIKAVFDDEGNTLDSLMAVQDDKLTDLVSVIDGGDIRGLDEKGDVQKIAKNSIINSTNDYVYVFTDNEGRILLGIDKYGKIEANLSSNALSKIVDNIDNSQIFVKRVSSDNISEIPPYVQGEISSTEYIYVITDNEGRVLFGIDKYGVVHINSIQVNSIKLSNTAKETIKSIANSIYVNQLPSRQLDSYLSECYEYSVNEVVASSSDSNTSVISISSQDEFTASNVKRLITEEIDKGYTSIVVSLDCDVLSFDDNVFNFSKSNYPSAENVSIAICGNGVKMLPGGVDYTKNDAHKITPSYYECQSSSLVNQYGYQAYIDMSTFELLDVRSEVKYALSKTESVTIDGVKGYRIKLQPEDASTSATHVGLTGSWMFYTYKISKVENGYLYFKDSDGDHYFSTQPTMDFDVCGAHSRYTLLNAGTFRHDDSVIRIPIEVEKLRVGTSTNFLKVSAYDYTNETTINVLKSLSISGINFIGSSVNTNYKGDTDLISVIGFDAEYFSVKNCTFKNIPTNAIRGRYGTSNILIDNCRFESCKKGVNLDSKGRNISFVRNYSTQKNTRYPIQGTMFSINGSEVLVRNNVFEDFCYGGVSTGIYCTSFKEGDVSSGVIEYNVFKLTDDFLATKTNYILMDSGACYVTMNTNLHIRNNQFFNIQGHHFNNAIYCDDGARGFRIYGNAFIGTYSYEVNGDIGGDIHARFVSEKGEDTSSPNPIFKHNSDGFIGYNLITGYYLFQGNSNETGLPCRKGSNIVIAEQADSSSNTLSNIAITDEDYYLRGCKIRTEDVLCPSVYRNTVKDFPMSNVIKKVLKFNLK